MAIVQQGLGAGLGEAGVLLVWGALEAVWIGLEVEGAGEEVGVLHERGGVAGWGEFDLGEVGFYAGLLEARLCEVL